MEPAENYLASLFPNIAAQMRGPLSNLHMAASLLISAEERENDPALDAKAAVFDQSYYQLLRLVNSLSSAAYLADTSPLPLRDRDLVDLVGEICDQTGDLARHRGVSLRFVCAPERHICAVAPEAMELLVYHLLSNALKFTPAGGMITVELRFTGERVFLSVEDTGCGIPEDRLPTLFERYLHAEQLEPPPHGVGLGLPLCRCIAERQGGALLAESQVGKGSRFTLSLPDRQMGGELSDVPFDYTGGFNRALLSLSDALPVEAFRVRNQD